MRDKGSQPNQGLIDGIKCLHALALKDRPVGTRELARELNVDTTRINRLLKTLAYLGIAEQTPEKKYTHGPAIHVLAAQCLMASGIFKRAINPLHSLSAHGSTVALGVLWEDKVTYLYYWEPRLSEAEALAQEHLYPASKSSIGRTLLAEKSTAELRHLYFKKEIPGIPGGYKELRKILSIVKASGYTNMTALNREVTLSVPVGLKPYAAISLSGKFKNDKIPKYVSLLKKTASEIDRGSTETKNRIH